MSRVYGPLSMPEVRRFRAWPVSWRSGFAYAFCLERSGLSFTLTRHAAFGTVPVVTLRRRTILKTAAGAAVVASPLAYLFQRRSEAADTGPLLPDPSRLLDLPAHFRYTVLERTRDRMSDGNRVPARPAAVYDPPRHQ